MIWKMREETAQRLRAFHTAKARDKARTELSGRLTDRSLPFSLLSDKAQDDLLSRLRAAVKREEREFETTHLALKTLIGLAHRSLPELCIFASWSIDEGAAALLKRDDAFQALKQDPTVFSSDGCIIASPDGATIATFDFDMPWEVCSGYVHLRGEGWPTDALAN
ncbi:hypothetical protein [Caulobacter segnis]